MSRDFESRGLEEARRRNHIVELRDGASHSFPQNSKGSGDAPPQGAAVSSRDRKRSI